MSLREYNQQVFESGIESGISGQPEDFDQRTVNEIVYRLDDLSTNEPYVLVHWGQDFGGSKNFLRYHPQSVIENLMELYSSENVRGIYPKAGAVFDKESMKKFPLPKRKEEISWDEVYGLLQQLNY